ncbi:MAG TPA: DinB family protein [Bryobacteraceae bacterium]|nr:DinB family protein [Bryobacteraceae bacterium]
MIKNIAALSVLAAVAILPALAQQVDVKAAILKRLKTSEDFTLKVADAMPASDYSYKLTPEQMSFGRQMTHLAQSFTYFLSAFSGTKPNPTKPASDSKADVVAFVKSSYEKAIDQVSQLSNEQLAKTYGSGEESRTGLDVLLSMLAHADHHRASAEMYLRAKGITPPKYED